MEGMSLSVRIRLSAMILSMLVMVPFTLYFSLGSQFFSSQGSKLVTVTMNWSPVWMVTTIISAVLLGVFCFLFKDDVKSAVPEAVTEAPAEA